MGSSGLQTCRGLLPSFLSHCWAFLPLPDLHVACPRAAAGSQSRRKGFIWDRELGEADNRGQSPLSSRCHHPVLEGLCEHVHSFLAAAGAAGPDAKSAFGLVSLPGLATKPAGWVWGRGEKLQGESFTGEKKAELLWAYPTASFWLPPWVKARGWQQGLDG